MSQPVTIPGRHEDSVSTPFLFGFFWVGRHTTFDEHPTRDFRALHIFNEVPDSPTVGKLVLEPFEGPTFIHAFGKVASQSINPSAIFECRSNGQCVPRIDDCVAGGRQRIGPTFLCLTANEHNFVLGSFQRPSDRQLFRCQRVTCGLSTTRPPGMRSRSIWFVGKPIEYAVAVSRQPPTRMFSRSKLPTDAHARAVSRNSSTNC